MNENESTRGLMKPDRPVGIVGYGAYVPRYRLPATEVSEMWTGGTGGTPIIEKSVNGLDEDVATMSVEAARNALARAQIDVRDIRAVHFHPLPARRQQVFSGRVALGLDPVTGT